jgi:hypothetical protein
MNTQFANIATPSEVVIAISFTLEFSGNSSELHICLPYSMIEPIRDLLHSTMHSEQASADNRWTHADARVADRGSRAGGDARLGQPHPRRRWSSSRSATWFRSRSAKR